MLFVLGAFPTQSMKLMLLHAYKGREEQLADELFQLDEYAKEDELYRRGDMCDIYKPPKFSITAFETYYVEKFEITDWQLRNKLLTLGYMTHLDELNTLEEEVQAVASSMSNALSGDRKWRNDLGTEYTRYIFMDYDLNGSYCSAAYYTPLPLGLNGPPEYTKDHTVALNWLNEDPISMLEMPFKLGVLNTPFPVSHYGVYLVDLDPPPRTFSGDLPTSVIPVKRDDGTIDWNNFDIVRGVWLDSFTLWSAINLQGWELVKIHQACKYDCSNDLAETYKKLYDKKMELKSNGDDLSAEILKKLTNTRYSEATLRDETRFSKISTEEMEIDVYDGGNFLNYVYDPIKSDEYGTFKFTVATGKPTEPNQLNSAITSGYRLIMDMIAGNILTQTKKDRVDSDMQIYYQDVDSYCVNLTLAEVWNEAGTIGNGLCKLKNQTVGTKDAVGILGYFPSTSSKWYVALDLEDKVFTEKMFLNGVGYRCQPKFVLTNLVNFIKMCMGKKVDFVTTKGLDLYFEKCGERDREGCCTGGKILNVETIVTK